MIKRDGFATFPEEEQGYSYSSFFFKLIIVMQNCVNKNVNKALNFLSAANHALYYHFIY
jgi:hypothetical protein